MDKMNSTTEKYNKNPKIKSTGLFLYFTKAQEDYSKCLYLVKKINVSYHGTYILSNLWEYYYHLNQVLNHVRSSTKTGIGYQFYPLGSKKWPQYDFPKLTFTNRVKGNEIVEKYVNGSFANKLISDLNTIADYFHTNYLTKSDFLNKLISYLDSLFKLINCFKSYAKHEEELLNKMNKNTTN